MASTKRSELRECFVSTFPPRECGIATFTFDLRQAVSSLHNGASSTVIALTNTPEGYEYPPDVVFDVRQNPSKKLG